MVVETGREHSSKTDENQSQERVRRRGRTALTEAGVDVSNLKNDNDGTTFLLTFIKVFSKWAWCVLLKNKLASSLVTARKRFLIDVAPTTLQTDKGLEFVNRSVKGLLKEPGVHNFWTHNEETKTSIVERFDRTLKTRKWQFFAKRQTLLYI